MGRTGSARLLVPATVMILSMLAGLLGAPAAEAQGPVKIGFIYPDSGPLSQLGLHLRDGFLLYWSQVGNKAGGRPVEIQLENKGSNKPDEGLTKARKLVERDKVHVLGGIIATPVAYALRSYVIEKKIPLVIMNAGADGLTQRQRTPYIFRTSFSNSEGSHELGDWAYKQGYRKMVLMATDFGAGYEHIGGVARGFTEAGGRVIQEIYPPLGSPDFAPFLAQIKRDADVVATAIFGSDAVRLVAQYTEYGLKGKIALIGKAITLEDTLPAQGDAALGLISSYHYTTSLDIPENKRFLEAYSAKYRQSATPMAEQGYVGALILAQALEAVRGNVENQEAFLAALRRVEVDTPEGKVRFDSFQNPIHTFYITKVEKKGGVLQNTLIASYPNTTQFWKWTPEAFLAMPSYAELKGKWAK